MAAGVLAVLAATFLVWQIQGTGSGEPVAPGAPRADRTESRSAPAPVPQDRNFVDRGRRAEAAGVAATRTAPRSATAAPSGIRIQLLDGKFSHTNPHPDLHDASLTTATEAPPPIEATIKDHDPNKPCDTPPYRWLATAQPLPSPPADTS